MSLEWLKARVDQPCLVQFIRPTVAGWPARRWDGSHELKNSTGAIPTIGLPSITAFFVGVYGSGQIALVYVPGLTPLNRLSLDLVWSSRHAPTLSARTVFVYFFLQPPLPEPPSRQWPHICQCNAPALRMFSSIECSSPKCKFYVP